MKPYPAPRSLINLFIAWNLFAILTWTMADASSPLRACLLPVIQPYLAFTGLWQSWDMFAPNPRTIVTDVQAVVRRVNGEETTWQAPGPEQVTFGKYRLERWRKWRDSIRMDANGAVWRDTARFIARLHSDPVNPPARIYLVRRWADLPPPKPGDFQSRELLTPTKSFTYFIYDVRAEDLAG